LIIALILKLKNMLIELTEDTLQDLIQEEKVVVQFSASWCGNCRIMKQNSKLASENETITFALVDAEN
jgi:thiol-disulfide isomerase/thioredoxin